MAKVNKSYHYLLPLIKGWSAKADYPINSYARSNFGDSLILEYKKGSKVHPGHKIGERGETEFIKCDIDPRFIEDYNLLLRGKYSKINESTKASIISRACTLKDSLHTEKILYKSKKLKRFLEDMLGIEDLDKLSEEYDSKMFSEEIFNLIEYDETGEREDQWPESVEV